MDLIDTQPCLLLVPDQLLVRLGKVDMGPQRLNIIIATRHFVPVYIPGEIQSTGSGSRGSGSRNGRDTSLPPTNLTGSIPLLSSLVPPPPLPLS